MKYAGDGARQRGFATVVRVCMARKGIKNLRELAPMIGVDERGLYRRMRFENQWTLAELWRLVRVLEPSGDEMMTMLGVTAC